MFRLLSQPERCKNPAADLVCKENYEWNSKQPILKYDRWRERHRRGDKKVELPVKHSVLYHEAQITFFLLAMFACRHPSLSLKRHLQFIVLLQLARHKVSLRTSFSNTPCPSRAGKMCFEKNRKKSQFDRPFWEQLPRRSDFNVLVDLWEK